MPREATVRRRRWGIRRSLSVGITRAGAAGSGRRGGAHPRQLSDEGVRTSTDFVGGRQQAWHHRWTCFRTQQQIRRIQRRLFGRRCVVALWFGGVTGWLAFAYRIRTQLHTLHANQAAKHGRSGFLQHLPKIFVKKEEHGVFDLTQELRPMLFGKVELVLHLVKEIVDGDVIRYRFQPNAYGHSPIRR